MKNVKDKKLVSRLPLLKHHIDTAGHYLVKTAQDRKNRKDFLRRGQFRSPGQGMRGKGYGHQAYQGGSQGYPYSPGYRSGYPSPMHGGRAMGEGGEGYPLGDDNYGYQQMASDDSRDTQHSSGDMSQQQPTGFSGSLGEGTSLGESQGEAFLQDKPPIEPQTGEQAKSPPDIKYEVTPMPFIKPDEFELIEIDPDEEEDI